MKVIVNADDFGVSPKVNMAVYEAARQGYVTSATILAVSKYLDEAIDMSKEMKHISFGVHLAFTGDFHSLGGEPNIFSQNDMANLKGVNPGTLKILINEFDKQIEMVKGKGVQPTHVDTHHHIHLYPLALIASIVAAKRHGIRFIRSQRLCGSGKTIKSLYRSLHYMTVRLSRMIQPDCYSDFETFFRAEAKKKIKASVIEIMCHPGGEGFHDEAYFNEEFYSPLRNKLISYHGL